MTIAIAIGSYSTRMPIALVLYQTGAIGMDNTIIAIGLHYEIGLC